MNLYITPIPYINRERFENRIVASSDNEPPQLINFSGDMIENNTVIVLESRELVELCADQKCPLPNNFEDIFQLFKISCGSPIKIKDLSHEKIMTLICQTFVRDTPPAEVLNIVCQRIDSISSEYVSALYNYNSLIKRIHTDLLADLDKKNEFERYMRIEKPFNRVLANRQLSGIRISHSILNKRKEEVDLDLNTINKKLRFDYGVYDIRNMSEVRDAIGTLPYTFIRRSLNTNSFWNFVKTASEYNELFKLLHSSYRLRYDKRSLALMAFDSESTIHPHFDCSGTITSRTLVRRPTIQQLRKKSRDFIIAKDGFCLLYADYAQFEPGILADLSEDQEFRKCYTEEDLYSALSSCLFDSTEYRQLSKTVFLCFLYGMSQPGIKLLINDIFPHLEDIESKLDTFFNRFINLKVYKDKLISETFSTLKVSSVFGNYRYTNEQLSADLPNKVKRWILSQKIQGTASLILKTAVLKCNDDSDIEFLLPMHDAALFQVPVDSVEEKKCIIKNAFEAAFNLYCPSVKAKVVFKSFSE